MKKTQCISRITVGLGLALCLATLSPAPINDPRAATPPTPERTQDVVQQEQKQYTSVQGEVAAPPVRTDFRPMDTEKSDTSAKSALTQATNDVYDEGGNAEGVLKQAEKDLQGANRPNMMWLWGALFGALGFGIVFGLKQWATKQMPPPPSFDIKRDAKW
jgi:hypothetical protein